jgi:hypothetical protein
LFWINARSKRCLQNDHRYRIGLFDVSTMMRELGDKGSSVQIRPLRPIYPKVSGPYSVIRQTLRFTLESPFYSSSRFLFLFSRRVTAESPAK